MATQFIDSAELLGPQGQECIAWDHDVSDGALKTLIHRHNLAGNEVQPAVICYSNSKSNFKVKTKIISCIHGYMETVNDTATRPGTLLVLEYNLYPQSGHRFTEIYTSFAFGNIAKGASNPSVVSYAPFSRPRRFQPDKQTIERMTKFSSNLGVSEGLPVSAGVSGERSATKTYIQEYFAKGSAGIDPDDATGVENKIWWRLEENKLQKHGVLEVFRVAVLVERDNLDDFTGDFTMDVQGSFTTGIGKMAEWAATRFWRKNKLDDPVRFSPSKMALQGKTDGIDPNNLAALVRNTGQGEGIHLPESYDLESLLPTQVSIGQRLG
ncbi:hypothetical protein C8A00DRAFT_17405 [Chaetomidium leptoderma]|uniref:Uncharacterized protein n=1 Tax=Chaetomidium leptoderma TaxID=669021 RepID=A0AAN6ZV23_9PEZI|nr:hypothetical protein C8A00DRAFT_17405 [Chaetomidium leptoderma]